MDKWVSLRLFHPGISGVITIPYLYRLWRLIVLQKSHQHLTIGKKMQQTITKKQQLVSILNLKKLPHKNGGVSDFVSILNSNPKKMGDEFIHKVTWQHLVRPERWKHKNLVAYIDNNPTDQLIRSSWSFLWEHLPDRYPNTS